MKYRMSKNSERKLNPLISLVKVLAMYLIIQSHSDQLFPDSISFLATGGALGNELFFLTGGYLYSTKKGLWETTFKRFIRLYIPTYMMSVVSYIFGIVPFSSLFSLRGFLSQAIWPTLFWFVSAIFVNGILLHLLDQAGIFRDKRKMCVFFGGFVILYILVYIFGVSPKNVWTVEDIKLLGGTVYFKCIYSFAVFCLGYLLKLYVPAERIKVKEQTLYAGAVCGVLGFYGFKFALNRGVVPMELQLLSQPLTVISVLLIFFAIMNSMVLKKLFMKSPGLTNAVNKLGNITLESFLVQFELIHLVSLLDIAFPLNYGIAVLAVVAAAFVFQLLDSKVCEYLTRLAA